MTRSRALRPTRIGRPGHRHNGNVIDLFPCSTAPAGGTFWVVLPKFIRTYFSIENV